jgi:hypothetical protein
LLEALSLDVRAHLYRASDAPLHSLDGSDVEGNTHIPDKRFQPLDFLIWQGTISAPDWIIETPKNEKEVRR